MKATEKNATFFVLILFGVVLLAHHFWGHGGHFGFDDMTYARLAGQLANGNFHVTGDHYTFRWAIIACTGICYKIFGINDWASAIPALIATLVTLYLVWKMAARLPFPARLFAVAFTLLSEWVFFYSNKIMPDIPVMMCVTLALFAYWQLRFGAWQSLPHKASVTMVAALLLGFLFKETIILALPVFALLMLTDIWKKQAIGFWKLAGLLGTVGFGLYFILIYAITGDPGGRFRAIAANSYFSGCSYDLLPVEYVLRRVGYELWGVFFQTGVGLSFVFILTGWFQRALRKETTAIAGPNGFFLFSATALLLLSNFMTTSPTAYVPLCLDIRHYLFVIPFAGLATAAVAADWIKKTSGKTLLIPGILSVLAAWIAYRWYPDQFRLYLLFAVAILTVTALKKWKKSTSEWVLWLLLSVALCWKPAQVMRAAQKSNYTAQKEMVNTYFRHTQARYLMVITNPVEKNTDEYLLGFDTTRVRFMSFRAIDTTLLKQSDSIALVINGSTAYQSGMDWEDMPDWVRQPDASRVSISSGHHIDLFGLNKSDLLRRVKVIK